MAEEVAEKSGGVFLIPRSPWGVLFEGIGILALGIVLVAWPGASVKVVRIAFGIFALVFGGIQVFDAASEKQEDRWWRIPLAVISIAAGIFALAWPDATERVILIILGLWFVITGVVLMAAGLKLPEEISARWVVVVAGVVALGFGIYLIIRPSGSSPDEVASTVVRLIGVFAIIEGLLIAVYSFLLRRVLKGAGA
ncbi:MAG: hypothetical protein C4536_00285 [Actinobacteria bacterium]|jgi:uncharacterized membrane protein HdeD (DUF308 family)|nr:MAG: hypothetical protein C4536_00285 [Actinomycetota bacterium]